MTAASQVSIIEPIMPHQKEQIPSDLHGNVLCEYEHPMTSPGEVLQLSLLCKEGYQHNKKHFFSSAGSASCGLLHLDQNPVVFSRGGFAPSLPYVYQRFCSQIKTHFAKDSPSVRGVCKSVKHLLLFKWPIVWHCLTF